MARDVSVMFDELKALSDRHAELHADRARLQAQGEQTTEDWTGCTPNWNRRGDRGGTAG